MKTTTLLQRLSRPGAIAALLLLYTELAMAMPIPDAPKKCVVFILSDDASTTPLGTAFYAGTPLGQDRWVLYLVTARHVLLQEGKPRTSVLIRQNTKDGKSTLLRADLTWTGPGQNTHLHSDPAVDLAVVRVMLDQAKHDFAFIPSTLIPSREEFKRARVREGFDVFFTGLFVQYLGQTRNQPIVRFGRVALVADEKIPMPFGPSEVLLLECASYGGNSGSPVFFYLGADREPGALVVGPPDLKLAGVMLGTFTELSRIEALEATHLAARNSVGISVVTPAYLLRELLDSTPK